MPLARYFDLCLSHPEYGYYVTREPFGAAGDFITAPEISQMFGELIGVWCAAVYQALGAPRRFALMELGPGRGTLMADLLRAAAKAPGFSAAVEVHLVETSPRLRAVQRETLGSAVHWHDRLETVPEIPAILVANEFFDALSLTQLEKRAGHWFERVVGLDDAGGLCFGLAPDPVPPPLLPSWLSTARDGDIAEISPPRTAVAAALGARLARSGGAALLIDYGHAAHGFGDTLQAMRAHGFVNPLDSPGMADLTSHVDFAALAEAATGAGAAALPVITQGAYLHAMGIGIRAARLGAPAAAAVDRLTSDAQMGKLFKVLCVTGPGLIPPYPFGPA